MLSLRLSLDDRVWIIDFRLRAQLPIWYFPRTFREKSTVKNMIAMSLWHRYHTIRLARICLWLR